MNIFKIIFEKLFNEFGTLDIHDLSIVSLFVKIESNMSHIIDMGISITNAIIIIIITIGDAINANGNLIKRINESINIFYPF